MEGDDYWISPHKLQEQADFLDTHPDYVMCFTDTVYYPDGINSEPCYRPDPKPLTTTLTIEDLLRRNPIGTPSVMFRNRLLTQFPDWFFTLSLADWPLYILITQYGKVGYLPRVTACYRVHQGGIHSGLSAADQNLRTIPVLEALRAYLGPTHERLVDEVLASRYYGGMYFALLDRDLATATTFAVKAVRSGALRSIVSEKAFKAVERLLRALLKSPPGSDAKL